ncbi:MAG: N-6 DNA methylase [Candidatus Heimdallarchaeota archaeon]|nr:MAG: N-6 DNA methylase [Candidatus Heimdallarchaeota archaeon]
MNKSDLHTEEEVLNVLVDAVNEVESYTKKVGFNKFDRTLGFFFARVLDNKITRTVKRKKEYESAIVRSAAFVIVTQIFIYIVLLKKHDDNGLDSLSFKNGKDLQKLFDKMVTKQNYGVIFNAQVVELLPNESVSTLNRVFKKILQFRYLQYSTDILGKIFHGLIPFDLRKFLAAYYTSNIVGEFLSYLVIKKDQINLMDPACGSGTLLVSAYKRINELNGALEHDQILQKLFGIDVSVFAAHLAEINLAIQNPTDLWSNCQIEIIDFFEYSSRMKGNKTQLGKFDILLGNPPFTRGDRLDSEYKDFLEAHLRHEGISINYNKKYLGLYAYFLLDSLRFLKKNGILAFILPLSLINSSTMRPVLKFLFSRFHFKYIITSEVQTAFSEQCTFKEILFIAQRGQIRESKTKFIVLKTELTRKNYRRIGKIIEEATNETYEDLNIRINLIPFQTLKENIDLNWVVYLFNQRFFNLFEQIRNLNLTSPIAQLVKTPRYDVDRGFRAGISNFFYLPNKYWKITEQSKLWIKIQNIETNTTMKLSIQYLSPVLRKSSLYERIMPKISDFVVVIPPWNDLDEAIKHYVNWGVQKFRKTGFETLAFKHIEKGRKIARIAITHELSLLSNKIIAYYSPNPVILSDNFIFIRTYEEFHDKIIAAYLNSSIFLLTYFVLRREKTGALGQIFGTDVRNFFCLDPKKVIDVDRRDLFQIFDQFILESSHFKSFYYQIKDAMNNKNHIRHLLDRKICEILGVPDVPIFMKQVYEILNEELYKFH